MTFDLRSTRFRFVALILSLAVFASACVSGSETIEQDRENGSPSESDESTPSGGDDSIAVGSDDSEERAELVSTTDNPDPFNLDGGATTSDEGVTIADGEPRDDLSSGTASVSGLWDTDWARRTIDVSELEPGLGGIDPRDGIPPIDTPLFEPISNADWLADTEPGALVRLDDEVRFYPLSILTSHEIVNDRIGDIPVSVTFCPLCNTAITFDRRVDGEVLRFGVSGLLRKSDLVMWDDKTDSLWQQLTGQGIVGTFAGTQLDIVPTAIVSYSEAKESFPQALSLAQDSGGYGRSYGQNPYVGYSSSRAPFLFDGDPDPRFPALSRVVSVSLNQADKAYPFSTMVSQKVVNDTVGGTPIVVMWGGNTNDALDGPSIAESDQIGTAIAFERQFADQVLTFSAVGTDQFSDAETGSTWNLLGQAVDGPMAGETLTPLPHRNEFWFAWAAFFPDGEVHGQ